MPKVAHPFPAAPPRSAPEGRSPRADGVAAGRLPTKARHASPQPAALRPVLASGTSPAQPITPPGGVVSPAAALPDLAARLERAGLVLPAPLLTAHARAMDALLGGEHGSLPPRRATQAAATLGSVYQAFLARLPDGPAAAGPDYQAVASSLMAHALLINQVGRSGRVPPDLAAFLDRSLVLPPSRLDGAAPASPAR